MIVKRKKSTRSLVASPTIRVAPHTPESRGGKLAKDVTSQFFSPGSHMPRTATIGWNILHCSGLTTPHVGCTEGELLSSFSSQDLPVTAKTIATWPR